MEYQVLDIEYDSKVGQIVNVDYEGEDLTRAKEHFEETARYIERECWDQHRSVVLIQILDQKHAVKGAGY